MESDPLSQWVILSNINITHFSVSIIAALELLVLVIMLFISALVSGSEVAFFSLKPAEVDRFRQSKSKNAKAIIELLEQPKNLLATILVSNNFVNIGIVILSTYLTHSIFGTFESPLVGFLIEVVCITFVLLLFGEIIPKVFANRFSVKFAKFIAIPLLSLNNVLKPISFLLVSSSSLVDRRIQKKNNISMDELSDALEITSDSIKDDKEILKGIVEFGNTEVSEIMCPRVDVTVLEFQTGFSKVLELVNKAGYSRIPVYKTTFDNVAGILYIKDLLPHLEKDDSFKWQTLIRPPYFVPEKKKINDLLKELQVKKNHLAIVVDEYGGTSGIVTMEDIIEEIIGDITDEFDDEDLPYVKINDFSYLFDGKILINDLERILEVESEFFDEVRGDADTLAGMILEIRGEFPKTYDKINFKNWVFIIEEVDKRRIKKIKAVRE